MNWKWFRFLGVSVSLTLLVIPLSYLPAAHGSNLGSNLVDPIKTDAGYVSGTIIDVAQRCWIYIPCLLTGGTECTECADTLLGEPGKAVHVYRGISYAAPPVGDLRWKPPQPVKPWEGIRECTKFTPMAPQEYDPPNPFWGGIPESGISEDCLYLNVATPAKHEHDRLPVMVWFHGGGITSGTNSPDGVYDYIGAEGGMLTPPLPNHGIVLVTVQHRIGPFGYMAHPALTAESPEGASGNYGQLDLIAALKWVKRNIAAFGGDPDNVTIFGQSGGGMKVNWLMASPLAKGLFQRAICESGFSTSSTPLADAEQYGVNLAERLGITNTGEEGLAQLRDKSWQEIIDAVYAEDGPTYQSVFTVDGWSLTDTIGNIFRQGKNSDVPYMVGVAGAEVGVFFPMSAVANLLLTMSEQQRSPIYTYVFTQAPDGWKDEGVYAWHGSDVAYEFGDITALDLFPGALLPATLSHDPGVTYKDSWVAEFMMSMLAEFADTGRPSVKEMAVYWPAYDDRDLYLDIGYKPVVKDGYSKLTTQQPPR